MNKLLVIVGPTATGKTTLALHLSKILGGEIISADSRQVYKEMDIGTGKDKPKDVKIFGYDLVGPKEEFSVASYLSFARRDLTDVWRRKKLPILVGGTGLYIKGVVDGIPTAIVPRDERLRNRLSGKSVDELFGMLMKIDVNRANSMNNSDRHNPRRLVRAIEVAQFKLTAPASTGRFIDSKYDVLFIGLAAPRETLERRIEKRVDERIRAGVEAEIKKLLENGVSWKNQSMTSLGYRQWKDYFEGKKEKEVVISEWKREEKKYAKRQLTWFKADKRIKWFDIVTPKWQEKVEKLVKKWYK